MYKVKNIIDIRGNSVTLYEISFESYRNVLKILFRSSQIKFFVENLLDFIKCYSNITNELLYSLNIAEVLILLIELRSLSKGGGLQMRVKNGKAQEGEQTVDKYVTYTKNIIDVQSDLLKLNNSCIFTFKDVAFKVKAPQVVCYFTDVKTHDFIEWVEFKHERVYINQENYSTLPLPLTICIIKKIDEYIRLFEDITYVSINKDPLDITTQDINLSLSLNYSFFAYFIDLLYGDNLLTLHENMFKLSQLGKIDLNYINNCTPGEVSIYVKLLNTSIKENSMT